MPKLLLIRGLPGSGKSIRAKALGEQGYVHVEADMYFQTERGYEFNAADLGKAHDWCHKTAAKALEHGDNVVVSNPFTQRWEMIPYREMATKLHCEFEVLEATGNSENTHNVPEEHLARMRKRWQPWY